MGIFGNILPDYDLLCVPEQWNSIQPHASWRNVVTLKAKGLIMMSIACHGRTGKHETCEGEQSISSKQLLLFAFAHQCWSSNYWVDSWNMRAGR